MRKRIDFDKYFVEPTAAIGGGVIIGDMAALMNDSMELAEVLALVEPNTNILWYSDGRWSSIELLIALLNITGPAVLHIGTYALSETSARHMVQLKEAGIITQLSIALDNRVDTRTAGSLQVIKAIADSYALAEIHAKVTVVENANWQMAIVGSANYTENNRYEAGIISCTIVAAERMRKFLQTAIKNGTK